MASHLPTFHVALLGGAPPKPYRTEVRNVAKRQRNKALTIRFTEDELAYFKQQQHKSKIENQSEFLLALLKSEPIVVVEELRTVTAELRRQGTNLNQIARYLNSGGYLDTEVMATLVDCRSFYQKLKRMEVK